MHHSDDSEFMKTVEDIKKAEDSADSLKADAKEKSEHIIKKGKESVLKINSETNNEVIKLKNRLLHEGKDGIEKEVDHIVEKAHSEGESLRKKKIGKEDAISLLKQFVLSL
ncbi:MAG: hypothetical protein WCT31_04985 [Candidatus Micrarchaeia archaeon]|jgi:vacuolar-type H+-ATPase subunit H